MKKVLRFDDHWQVSRELAKKLDHQLGKIDEFSGDECMRKMSPIVKKLLTREEVSSITLIGLSLHVRDHLEEHSIELAKVPDATWGAFYDSLIWKTFSALLATVLPNISEENVGECLVKAANGIIILDDAIADPELWHFNRDREVLLIKDPDFNERNELALTIEPRAIERLKQMGGLET